MLERVYPLNSKVLVSFITIQFFLSFHSLIAYLCINIPFIFFSAIVFVRIFKTIIKDVTNELHLKNVDYRWAEMAR